MCVREIEREIEKHTDTDVKLTQHNVKLTQTQTHTSNLNLQAKDYQQNVNVYNRREQ